MPVARDEARTNGESENRRFQPGIKGSPSASRATNSPLNRLQMEAATGRTGRLATLVGAVALSNGWLSGDWLVIIALALTITFVVAAPLNALARTIATWLQDRVRRFESSRILPEDTPIDLGNARFAIIGMARFGTGIYDTLKATYGDVLIGADPDPSVVDRHLNAGRNVVLADVTNDDFWLWVGGSPVNTVLLAMSEHEENLGTAHRIQDLRVNPVSVFAVADFPEQTDVLRTAGVTAVWNVDTEAGTGFAEEVISHMGDLEGGVD